LGLSAAQTPAAEAPQAAKSYTKHLYAKLGVHNRHRAVARARDLKPL